MKPWLVDAFIAMTFAGVTTVIAKQGLAGVSAELGIGVRTVFVFFFVMAFVLFVAALGLIAFGFAYLALQILLWIFQ